MTQNLKDLKKRLGLLPPSPFPAKEEDERGPNICCEHKKRTMFNGESLGELFEVEYQELKNHGQFPYWNVGPIEQKNVSVT